MAATDTVQHEATGNWHRATCNGAGWLAATQPHSKPCGAGLVASQGSLLRLQIATAFCDCLRQLAVPPNVARWQRFKMGVTANAPLPLCSLYFSAGRGTHFLAIELSFLARRRCCCCWHSTGHTNKTHQRKYQTKTNQEQEK